MDDNRLHAFILELHDRLNKEDWERVHFYLGTDPSPKLNEEQFSFLLNLFEKNQCQNAVEFLKGKLCFHYEPFWQSFFNDLEHWKLNQSTTLNQVTGSLSVIMPRRINDVLKSGHEDKGEGRYARKHRRWLTINFFQSWLWLSFPS